MSVEADATRPLFADVRSGATTRQANSLPTNDGLLAGGLALAALHSTLVDIPRISTAGPSQWPWLMLLPPQKRGAGFDCRRIGCIVIFACLSQT